MEHLTLLLFLFHHLTVSQRKILLVEICQCLIRIHARIQGKTKLYSPLLISRLLVILDYILYQFDEPSPILLNIIENNLLNINTKSNLSNDQNLKSTSNVDFSMDKSNELPIYPAIESIEKFYLKFKSFKLASKNKPPQNVLTKSSFLIKPCFYSLKTTDLYLLIDNSTRISKFPLDIFNENIDYDLFYFSLFELVKLSSDINFQSIRDETFTNKEFVSIIYNFVICWSLLNPLIESTKTDSPHYGTLPVSKQFLSKVLNEMYIIYSSENDQELNTAGVDNNFELIQILRVAFCLNGEKINELNPKLSLSSIFGKNFFLICLGKSYLITRYRV